MACVRFGLGDVDVTPELGGFVEMVRNRLLHPR